MLAYLFWHCPDRTVNAGEYEHMLVQFHEAIRGVLVESAAFRLDQLPFTPAPGYEDWYLIGDWAALGDLNREAVSGACGQAHDDVAGLAQQGWGGVYRLMHGSPHPPEGGRWVSKPESVTYESFPENDQADSVWQRQLVLGPAPEFFVSAEPADARSRVWPPRKVR
jgi:hypothetical protein